MNTPPCLIEVRGTPPGLYDPNTRPPLLRITLHDLRPDSITAATNVLLEHLEAAQLGQGQFRQGDLIKKILGLLTAGKLAAQIQAAAAGGLGLHQATTGDHLSTDAN